jgi:hypothetical protein
MPGSGAGTPPVRQIRSWLRQRGRDRADCSRHLFFCDDACGGLSPAPARFPLTQRPKSMQTRLGRIALHGAFLTSALGRSCARAFSSPVRESSPLASDTPVASSVLVGLGRCYAVPTLWLGGRQDRFRGGLVKGVRIPDPGCLQSSVATRIPAAPKHGRNHVAFTRDAALT